MNAADRLDQTRVLAALGAIAKASPDLRPIYHCNGAELDFEVPHQSAAAHITHLLDSIDTRPVHRHPRRRLGRHHRRHPRPRPHHQAIQGMGRVNLPPRWRIRRTPTGRWGVELRADVPSFGRLYVPMGTWDTWDTAIAYAARVQANNYGRAA